MRYIGRDEAAHVEAHRLNMMGLAMWADGVTGDVWIESASPRGTIVGTRAAADAWAPWVLPRPLLSRAARAIDRIVARREIGTDA